MSMSVHELRLDRPKSAQRVAFRLGVLCVGSNSRRQSERRSPSVGLRSEKENPHGKVRREVFKAMDLSSANVDE
jgi:hypothetical protein